MHRITLLTNPDKCNLHCPLCFLNQRPLQNCGEGCVFGMGEMIFEIARAAIEKYAAARDASGNRLLREVIPSTMGEPLLYSHFDELLEFCRLIGIPLNLTTNGTFPGKWAHESAMELLLLSCSDIKVSHLASEQFGGWKANVEKLMTVRRSLCVEHAAGVATVSLQVTLHRKNLDMVPDLVKWTSSIGIARIKWNTVFFLSVASAALKSEFALDVGLDEVRNLVLDATARCGCKVRNEGSLFMKIPRGHFSQVDDTCPFTDEVWILPDGSEDHCPNPERRYVDKNAGCCFL